MSTKEIKQYFNQSNIVAQFQDRLPKHKDVKKYINGVNQF